MKIQYLQILYKLCLIITGTSAVNLSMNTYFIRQLLKKEFQKFSQLQTVDQILQTPQSSFIKENRQTQMSIYGNKNKTSVAFFNDKAYWIKNNQVYSSKLKEDGDLDIENAIAIDVFSLSDKEMNNFIKIIDKLRGR